MRSYSILKLLIPGAALLAATIVSSQAERDGTVVEFGRPAAYPQTQDDNDPRQLVDGKHVEGTMWSSKDAVGWYADLRPIEIRMRLRKPQPVQRVCVRSARRDEAGVSFPQGVDVFGSLDGGQFAWLADAVAGKPAEDGEYAVREFCADLRATVVSELRLLVHTGGTYFFTDEISVLGAGQSAASLPDDRQAGREIERFALMRRALLRSLDNVSERTDLITGAQSLTQLRELREAFDKATGPRGLSEARRLLAKLHARAAREDNTVELSPAAPYGPAGPFDDPRIERAAPLSLAPGWQGAVAASIMATGSGRREVELSATVTGQLTGSVHVEMFEARPILAAAGGIVADPLEPVRSLQLEPGERRLVWLAVSADFASMSGRAKVILNATDRETGLAQRIRYPVQVAAIAAGRGPDTVVWGYLDPKAVGPAPRAAVEDMLGHGVTTAVLPSWQMPWPAERAGVSSADYTQFEAAMGQLSEYRRFLFFLGLDEESRNRGLGLNQQFLSAPWRERFVRWIKEWSGRMQDLGLSEEQFAFYPVDEPSSPGEVAILVELAQLIKRGDPGLQVYVTIHRPDLVTERMIEAVDVFQLNDAALDPNLIKRLRQAGKTVWYYRSEGGGKAADPSFWYRAQGWTAFSAGLGGFGFWAYDDVGPLGTAWDDLDGQRPDFAVVYAGGNGLVSSRRWEAWREGVQDYQLLAAAMDAAPSPEMRERVRTLARQGAAALNDAASLADIRRELMAIASRWSGL